MPSSIRFRLAAAFALVTLVAVGALGGMALGLLRSLTQHQEANALRANAEVVAGQALPLLTGVALEADLETLAFTSAFVGDRRVRILSADGMVVADSGPRPAADRFVVFRPAAGWSTSDGGPQILLRDSGSALPAGVHALRVQQHRGPLGTQFDIAPWGHPMGASAEVAIAIGARSPTDMALPARSGHDDQSFADLGPEDVSPSLRAVRVSVGAAEAPVGFVELSGGPDTSGHVLAAARHAISAAAAIATLAAAALGFVFSRSLTAPLASLSSAARRLEAGDLSTRSAAGGPEEIDALSGAFNRMAASLERTVSDLEADRDALRRFVADASHQLRTPITALTTYHELLRGPAGDTQADREAFLEEGAEQLARLQWITANLLDLSRLDAGLADLAIDEVPAADLLNAAAAGYRRRALQAEVVLTVEVAEADLAVSCDRARMELALGNLLDNALKSCDAGNSILLSARRHESGGVDLRVRDSGSGIDADDLPRIFDRFYQGRRRAVAANPPGAGLGLAVVRAIVGAHRGSVEAHSEEGSGSLFTIVLPKDDLAARA